MKDESSPLVIGFGNPLRGDDGAGLAAAQALAEEADVVLCRQLTPELSERLGKTELAIFLDAAADGRPAGEVRVVSVQPYEGAAASFSHRLGPAQLLRLSRSLYGHCPRAFAITIGAQSFAFEEEVSPPVRAALPTAIEAARQLLNEV